MITGKVLEQNQTITIVFVYAPNEITARLSIFEDCYTWFSRLSPDEKKIAGDLNTCY